MKSISHLHKIHRLLSESQKSGITLPTLQRKSGLSRPTVYRVLKKLKELGAPLTSPRRGFYAFASESAFELPGFAWLSEGELGTLLGLMAWLGQPESEALEEIIGPFRKRVETMASRLKIDGEKLQTAIALLPMHARVIRPGILRQTCEGLLSNRKLRIRYGDEDDFLDREVSPQKLVRYRDNWYLDAFCHVRQALRIFSLSRIRRLELLAEPAESVPRAERDAFFATSYGIFSGTSQHTAILRFTGYAAQETEAETWHPLEQKSRDQDALVLRFPYGDSRELVRDILRWGPEVEVLGPVKLRDQVAEMARQTASQY